MHKIRVYCLKCGWIGKDTFASICPECASLTRKASDYLLCEKHINCGNFEIGKMSIDLASPEKTPFFLLYCRKQDSGCDRDKLYQCNSLIHLQHRQNSKIDKRHNI